MDAYIDEEGLRCQGVVRILALLHSSSHVVVLEGQAVCPLVRLDHAVLAVPYLRPAACRINGTVGHRAVQVVGVGYTSISEPAGATVFSWLGSRIALGVAERQRGRTLHAFGDVGIRNAICP